MNSFHHWWTTQQIEVKAALIGGVAAALTSAFIGVFTWFLFGIPRVVEWHYKRVLMDIDDTREKLKFVLLPTNLDSQGLVF